MMQISDFLDSIYLFFTFPHPREDQKILSEKLNAIQKKLIVGGGDLLAQLNLIDLDDHTLLHSLKN